MDLFNVDRGGVKVEMLDIFFFLPKKKVGIEMDRRCSLTC